MRNAEATRARILDAAMDEFAAHGVAGARVDRIAAKAGCNKNLIYIYFESKEKLFTTVMRDSLANAYEALPFTPDDLPGWSRRAFDYAMTNPHFMRLIAWFGLEQTVANPPERTVHWESMVSALEDAQQAGLVSANFDARFVLTATIALVSAYSAVNPFGVSLNQQAIAHPEQLRREISEAVSLIANAPRESQ